MHWLRRGDGYGSEFLGNSSLVTGVLAVIGEMWPGVACTIILELTPPNMHTTSIALYQFITVNIGETPSCFRCLSPL